MELKMICANWEIGDVIDIKEINQGFMNKTYSLVTEGNQSYILRLYESESDVGKVRREYEILHYLRNCLLPFEVPIFISNKMGDYVFQLNEIIAVIMPRIKGVNLDYSNGTQAYEAGKSLGELTKQLGQIEKGKFSEYGENVTYDQFRFFHPSIKDINQIIRKLPTTDTKIQELLTIFQQLDKEVEYYYPLLPKQYIHGDYTSGNVLCSNDQINGIIDFEFYCYDVRHMDLAIAIGGGPSALWELDPTLSNISMLIEGYNSSVSLTEVELLSIPFLIRLRRAAMFVYFTARYLEGLDSEGWMRGIIDWVLTSEQWLTSNKDELIRTIIAAGTRRAQN
ncbi:phosphotransferase [Bacillus sp. BGMRC 2118]|nr:phosphotransferase [Bacillus sp. BGMRC 2118]